MASWKYNEPGVTYNQIGFTYNGGLLATLKKYYTGWAHATKALLTRGLGF